MLRVPSCLHWSLFYSWNTINNRISFPYLHWKAYTAPSWSHYQQKCFMKLQRKSCIPSQKELWGNLSIQISVASLVQTSIKFMGNVFGILCRRLKPSDLAALALQVSLDVPLIFSIPLPNHFFFWYFITYCPSPSEPTIADWSFAAFIVAWALPVVVATCGNSGGIELSRWLASNVLDESSNATIISCGIR